MPWSNARPKATTKERGYSGKHAKLRKALLPAAYGTPCVRCGEPMLPGQELHFDHSDDRSGYLGFSHKACNLRAGAKKGRRVQRKTIKPKRVVIDRW